MSRPANAAKSQTTTAIYVSDHEMLQSLASAERRTMVATLSAALSAYSKAAKKRATSPCDS
jgi:hypothetical protein